MKKLLLLIYFISFIGFAQDSTSYTTQEVKEFVPLNILDEYEKAYGIEQKTALRIGVMNFNSLGLFGRGSLYFDFEHKITQNTAIKVGTIFSSQRANIIQNGLAYPIFLETKFYPNMKKRIENGKQKNNFTGKYLGVRFLLKDPFDSRYSSNFYEVIDEKSIFNRNQLEVFYGLQFGNTFDLRLVFGYNKIYNAIWVNENSNGFGNVIIEPQKNFYLKSQSNVSLNLLSFRKKNFNECEILKCNDEKNSAFKFNLMDMIYIDSKNLNLIGEGLFEKRVFNSFFTLNADLGLGYASFWRQYSIYIKGTNEVPFVHEKYASIGTSLGLRYYSSKRKNIIKGIESKNLSGFYQEMGLSNNFLYSLTNNDTKGAVASKLRPFLALGVQKIYANKYFIDTFYRLSYYNLKKDSFMSKNEFELGIVPLNFSFGIKAGLTK